MTLKIDWMGKVDKSLYSQVLFSRSSLRQDNLSAELADNLEGQLESFEEHEYINHHNVLDTYINTQGKCTYDHDLKKNKDHFDDDHESHQEHNDDYNESHQYDNDDYDESHQDQIKDNDESHQYDNDDYDESHQDHIEDCDEFHQDHIDEYDKSYQDYIKDLYESIQNHNEDYDESHQDNIKDYDGPHRMNDHFEKQEDVDFYDSSHYEKIQIVYYDEDLNDQDDDSDEGIGDDDDRHSDVNYDGDYDDD